MTEFRFRGALFVLGDRSAPAGSEFTYFNNGDVTFHRLQKDGKITWQYGSSDCQWWSDWFESQDEAYDAAVAGAPEEFSPTGRYPLEIKDQ